jgi:EAL domain-containing protein (putative c-di-GMP-specific phosphodiesterase class I)
MNRQRAILIVDDEAVLAKALARILAKEGYRVSVAMDVAEAKRAIDANSFDLILSDIAMPGESGFGLLADVRARGLSAPVLLMTGVPSVDSAAKAMEDGAIRYFTKPFSLDSLVAAVNEGVRQHDLADLHREGTGLVLKERRRTNDLAELGRRFDRGLAGLTLAFQPIVRCHARLCLGYEALLRTREPSLPNPGVFLEAAERLGRLHDLGRAVRQQAASAVPSAPSSLVFVNLHTLDLRDDELYAPSSPLSRVAQKVVLEITERAALDGLPDVEARVARLRKLGYRIAVDDLGAGYAGLTSTVQLRPDVVKFDMSLIRGIGEDAARKRLVASMISAFRDSGVTTVGEGVETARERDTMVDIGCDALQGFFYARPGPAFPTVTCS